MNGYVYLGTEELQNGITRQTTEENIRKKTRIKTKIFYRLEKVRTEMHVHRK
jgi:hypothetical protein